jgi:UDP-N-acetylmuramoyl-tripeptide--D-alanyl-D-alanine ligase
VIKRTFKEIAGILSVEEADLQYTEIAIQGVSTDSRTVQRGNLFIPLAGEHFDGHLYVKECYDKGAAAALWQKDHVDPPEGVPLLFVEDTLAALQQLAAGYRSELPVRIIGITGSNGKTTTKDLTAAILSTTYKTHKTTGNLNNHIGLPLTLLQLDDDTEMAVLEMGMSGRKEIELLSKLAAPEAAVITNIGEAHLEQLKSRAEIAKAKLEICSGLRPGGLLVYNGDEPLLEQTLSLLREEDNEMGFVLDPGMKAFRFGISEDNDISPSGIMLDGKGTHFSINSRDSEPYYIPLLGQHNVVNALASIAVCKYMGVGEQDILRGLKLVKPSGMRIEMVTGYNGVTVLNDAYNASPTSTRAALKLLEELKGYQQKFVVIGDMLELGENEKEFHCEIGRELNPSNADYIFTFGSRAEYIAKEAAERYASDRVRAMTDKRQIAHEILRLSNSRDVVLIKGSRGMKLEEVVDILVNGQ